MSGFELLGGILDIAQLTRVILRHVDGYRQVEAILEEVAARARRIHSNIFKLDPLFELDGVQTNFLSETVDEFKTIWNELVQIQKTVSNRSTARLFLSSPELVQKLSGIDSRLAAKEHNIKVLGAIGTLNIEQHFSFNEIRQILYKFTSQSSRICADVDRLKASSSDTQPAEKLLTQVYQKISMDLGLSLASERKGWWYGLDETDSFVNLATGVCLYNADFRGHFAQAARFLNAAVASGRTEAFYFLGMLHKTGQGVERCGATAARLFEKGARAKDPAAITQLGVCYGEGIGVEKDILFSADLIQQGAEEEDPAGMAYFAWKKLHGYCTDVNHTLAYSLSEKAVSKGFVHAKTILATCYDQGIGTDRDSAKAVKLWSDENCISSDLYIFILDLAEHYELGIGVAPDLTKAAELYKKGTLLDSWMRPYFYAHCGLCYLRGRGVAKSVTRGWAEIQKSVQANNGIGWYIQGECYRHGYGTRRNIMKAVESYRCAIRAENGQYGVVRAYVALGELFESGEGLPQDPRKAFEYYKFGADRMLQKAQWKIARAFESGVGVDSHEDMAVKYFRLAAGSGHEQAQRRAVAYYMKGKGVSRNLMSAVQILRPAAEQGDREAKRKLRKIRVIQLARRLLPKRIHSDPL